jgi:quercetin dioxygenase-like cupin family protein
MRSREEVYPVLVFYLLEDRLRVTATGVADRRQTMRHETEHKSFVRPEEVREFPHGRAEILNVGGAEVGRLTFQPGWRWSKDVKPIANTASCEAPHFQYHLSGRLAIKMDDGKEFVAGPGDVTSLPSGHDAWVVGNEPVVVVDWFGASRYAKKA